MTTSDDNGDMPGVPRPRKRAWILVFSAFALLAVTGLTLSILYRESPKSGDIVNKARKRSAKHVEYAIVFSAIPPELVDSVVNSVLASIPDTATTDLVIGSTVVDPSCANVSEYRRNLRRALTESRKTPLGKQTQIMSMVAGLLIKTEQPATLHLLGTLEGDSLGGVRSRTQQSAAGIKLRNDVIGPVSIVNHLYPTTSATHTDYISIFQSAGLTVTSR